MVTLLIGHRGSGKSSLLQRIAQYHQEENLAIQVFDLDQMIESGEGQSIRSIWETSGEKGFRELERQYLHKSMADSSPNIPVFVSVGAGFEAEIPKHARCLWVRRPSDYEGRIFLNRPRLDAQLSPMQEYLQRSVVRDQRYRSLANDELVLPEGFSQPWSGEKKYFLRQIQNLGGAITLQPSAFHFDIRSFLNERVNWGVRYFELRDDLLSPEQMRQASNLLPRDRILQSWRKAPELAHPQPDVSWDWPLEWGPHHGPERPTVVSLHEVERSETVATALARLERDGRGSFLKASFIVDEFSDLLVGHRWAMQDLKNRCFLPRSKGTGFSGGRWRWYRLLMKNRFRLNFFREGDGSSPDQPWLLEWLQNDFGTPWFAAILGDPVEHSLTPAEQSFFFAALGMPVLRIPISQQQWQSGALEVLEHLGLRFAAVTAPLKKLAYQKCAAVREIARKFQSVNTLRWTPQGWQGTNTDEEGLRHALRAIDSRQVAVWGGGGTLGPLLSVLPDAQFFSARLGQNRRDGKIEIVKAPEIVVWAIGRAHMEECEWPPLEWQPKKVIDLNYTENSPGREYALKVNAEYVSGLSMFYAQASKQRVFWSEP